MKPPQVGHGTSWSVLTAVTRTALALRPERRRGRNCRSPGMSECSLIRGLKIDILERRWEAPVPEHDTCPAAVIPNVIFNTELRFLPRVLPETRLSLGYERAAGLLVEVVEKLVPAGRKRPDIDHTLATGRDDLFDPK